MDNCIFCKIAAGKIPAKLVYEDQDMIAFHDINPAAPVHFLIVPREHIPTLADSSDNHAALLGKMMLLAPKLAQELGCGLFIKSYASSRRGEYSQFSTVAMVYYF